MSTDNTGSIEPFRAMLEEYYKGTAKLPVYIPYIPIQWVDAKQWGRDIGKSQMKQNYLEYLRDALDKETDESNDNG